MSIEFDRIREEHAALIDAMKRILECPKETMSDSKALRDIMRITKNTLAKMKELQSEVKK